MREGALRRHGLFRELTITERELEVIVLLVQGVPNAQVSSTLGVADLGDYHPPSAR